MVFVVYGTYVRVLLFKYFEHAYICWASLLLYICMYIISLMETYIYGYQFGGDAHTLYLTFNTKCTPWVNIIAFGEVKKVPLFSKESLLESLECDFRWCWCIMVSHCSCLPIGFCFVPCVESMFSQVLGAWGWLTNWPRGGYVGKLLLEFDTKHVIPWKVLQVLPTMFDRMSRCTL